MRSRGWRYPEEEEKKPEGKRYTHTQVSGMVLALGLFFYSVFFVRDVPMAFLTIAFLLFMLHPVICGLFGENVGKAVHSFSVAMCIGAFVLAFI